MSMLTFLGFAMVGTFMFLIMTKRLSPVVALIAVPVLFAFVGGFGGAGIGGMMLEGIRELAPTGVMLMFAILYFGVMIDAGLFDPIVRFILRRAGNDPMKIVVGTAVLATLISLDGDGSTTYMMVCAAMLPLYRRLKLDALILTCVTMLASGVMNLTPWGGPLARAATALQVDPSEVFLAMVPVMVVGIAGVMFLAYVLGIRERVRLGALNAPGSETSHAVLELDSETCRPKLRWVNALLTLCLLGALFSASLPLPVLFMIAFSIAIVLNYPSAKEQRARVAAHSANVIAVVSLIFAAGIFTGILSGTGMVDAMSQSLLAVLPDSLGPFLAPITALLSLPFTFFISNDAFYYGVMPVLADAAQAHGISHVEMARASLIGQPVHLLSPLVPSTYLLVGLADVEFGDHQRYALKWTIGICLILMSASLLLGVFPLVAG
jgi:citrate-Mg2+:H+ or citrate-Ca2+:H+ symporter, CitMHS family